MKKLSLLIPTIKRDEKLFRELINELYRQILPFYADDVEIIVDYDETDSVGVKRNRLLEKAKGKYLAYIDSDDMVSSDYIKLIMEGIDKDVDCCSLTGIITFDGLRPKKFIHYKDCPVYYETSEAYHRYPNHLNAIRAPISKQFRFPDSSWGEDTDFATQIKKSGLIKTEHTIERVIYFYKYIQNKKSL